MKIIIKSFQLLLISLLPLLPLTTALAGYPPGQPDGTNSADDTAADTWVYLPLLNTPDEQSNPAAPQARRVNAPFVDPDLSSDPMRDSTIFWFGKITRDDNYTDVRVRYETNRVVIAVEVFDRLLWYDNSSAPDKNGFPAWDSVTLLLNTDPVPTSAPSTASFRIDAMVNHWQDRQNYQAFYQGNGSDWELTDLDLNTTSTWNGDAFNNTNEDRGWIMRFSIPYANLGLSSTPDEGTIWQLGVIVYDRDDIGGRTITPSRWPENLEVNDPQTWGEFYFGIPKLPDANSPSTGTVMIRQGLENTIVADAAVGGTIANQCPGDSHFIWNVWGNLNFARAQSLNIQNQANVADWPCFAKYYVTFPIDQIPPGKVIQSAGLILHHWGNNGPTNEAEDSIIHVLSVSENWDEPTITWNNAPMALENIDHIRVPVVNCLDGNNRMLWPCTPRTWDVGRAVDQAYQNGHPVRLVLYSSDTAMHSGKLFSSSDVEDWNETGRPTLVITYGDR